MRDGCQTLSCPPCQTRPPLPCTVPLGHLSRWRAAPWRPPASLAPLFSCSLEPKGGIMRLWSLHPQYLDTAGLTACWREALLAQAALAGRTRGYTRHPQLNRFRESTDPLGPSLPFWTASTPRRPAAASPMTPPASTRSRVSPITSTSLVASSTTSWSICAASWPDAAPNVSSSCRRQNRHPTRCSASLMAPSPTGRCDRRCCPQGGPHRFQWAE